MKLFQVWNPQGLLGEFNVAGVLGPAEVHTARRLAALCGEGDERVLLALALTVRALRAGSVCLELATVAASGFELDEVELEVADLPWPEPVGWLRAVADSPCVTVGPDATSVRPLRLVADKLYLERYWGHEEDVRSQLTWRRALPPVADPAALTASLDHHFPGTGLGPGEQDLQRLAAETAATHAVTVIAGGPGTGKTTTVARLLSVLLEQPGRAPRIALAAPTGKAAVRLEESLRDQLTDLPVASAAVLSQLGAQTLHRLLGWRHDNRTRFRHDRHHPLPHDVVVVDECSMVSLHLMDRLLEALRPGARVVLVGDPHQLASVEAGAVLADVVNAGTDRSGVVELTRSWRFGSEITSLARAIREGDPDGALAALSAGGEVARLLDLDLTRHGEVPGLRERVVETHRGVWEAARAGDAAGALDSLDRHRLLCAHNAGPFGIQAWQWQVERWLAEELPGYRTADDAFPVGRPLLIGTNMRDLELYNGDSGVVVVTPDGPRAAFARGGTPRLFSPTQLADVSTLHAMTVHKSQGSQYDHVTLVLPPVGSPLLRRELLYTAVTRARKGVTIVGTEQAVRRAVATPARRATGLRDRL